MGKLARAGPTVADTHRCACSRSRACHALHTLFEVVEGSLWISSCTFGSLFTPNPPLLTEFVYHLRTNLDQKCMTDSSIMRGCLILSIRTAARGRTSWPPTEANPLAIFGNPSVGTALMDAAPSVALDLPLKALVWQDNESKVWLSYNNPDFLKQCHHLSDELIAPTSGPGMLIIPTLK